MAAYSGGYQFQVIANNNATLGTAVAAQKAALSAFSALGSNNTVLFNSCIYAGSTLGYVFIAICTTATTPPAPYFNIQGAVNWNVISNTGTVVATWAAAIQASLNSILTYNNQMPLLTDFSCLWDGTNLVSEIFTNYVTTQQS